MREIVSPLSGFRSPFGQRLGGGVALFSPLSLFASGEEGVWYEPSTSTAFLSETDLTPCGYGDACGFLLDKSQGAGYSGGSFTGLVELVAGGEFNDPADVSEWTDAGSGGSISWNPLGYIDLNVPASANVSLRQAVTVTPGSWVFYSFDIISIVGAGNNIQYRIGDTTGGSQIILATATGTGTVSRFFQVPVGVSTLHLTFNETTEGTVTLDNISVRELPGNHATQGTADARPTLARVPEGGRRNELVSTATLATQSVTVTAAERTLSFKGTGTVTLTGASTAGPLVGTGVSDRVTLTFTPSAGSLTLTVSGTVTDAQLELGDTATAYQLVADADGYDITEAGVDSLDYLSFDGTDDGMATAAIDFTGTDEMSVFAGVRKFTSDISAEVFAELSVDRSTNNGAWTLGKAGGSGNETSYFYASKGTLSVTALDTGFPANVNNVVTSLSDISGDSAILRVDGAEEATSTSDQGTGNFGNYPLYIGARGASSVWFEGNLYGLIVRGASSFANEINQTETYLANRSGVNLA